MSRFRTAGLAVTACATILTVSGCSVIAAFTPHVDAQIYETAAEFKAANTSAFGSPAFVPDDATVIRVDYDTDTGAAIMTYTSPTPVAQDTCPTPIPMPKAALQDSWWPVEGLPETASECAGGWSAFAIGNQIFATREAVR